LRAANIHLPILVGGAALTRKFTSTRILPAYGNLVAFARDAMKGLDLANSIVTNREAVFEKVKQEAQELSGDAGTKEAMSGVLLPPVRSSEINANEPSKEPPDTDRHVVEFRLSEVWPYLNQQMLLSKHLGLRGSVERLAEESDAKYLELVEVVNDVQQRAENGWMSCRAVYRYFPANSEGNRLLLFDSRGREIAHWDFPRQQKPDGLCLADFVKPLASGEKDSVAIFVTTAGEGVRQRAEELKQSGDYLLSHTLQALAVETAEAAAERIHRKIREGWNIFDAPDLTMQDRFKAKYQGIRVSFGYPACPNLADQQLLFRLLEPESIGVSLTDGFMMDPEASVSALVFHHSQARYFSVVAS